VAAYTWRGGYPGKRHARVRQNPEESKLRASSPFLAVRFGKLTDKIQIRDFKFRVKGVSAIQHSVYAPGLHPISLMRFIERTRAKGAAYGVYGCKQITLAVLQLAHHLHRSRLQFRPRELLPAPLRAVRQVHPCLRTAPDRTRRSQPRAPPHPSSAPLFELPPHQTRQLPLPRWRP
jgi:hypothetical protein